MTSPLLELSSPTRVSFPSMTSNSWSVVLSSFHIQSLSAAGNDLACVCHHRAERSFISTAFISWKNSCYSHTLSCFGTSFNDSPYASSQYALPVHCGWEMAGIGSKRWLDLARVLNTVRVCVLTQGQASFHRHLSPFTLSDLPHPLPFPLVITLLLVCVMRFYVEFFA